MAVKVIGAGLAGCEAAWRLAQEGINVKLYEMKPEKYSPARPAPITLTVISLSLFHIRSLRSRK